MERTCRRLGRQPRRQILYRSGFCVPGCHDRMVADLLAERGIIVSRETIRVWAEKFRRQFAGNIRRRSASPFDSKWHLNEVVITIRGKKHWLWRAVDQHGFVRDVLVQSRRNPKAATRLMQRPLKQQGGCATGHEHRQGALLRGREAADHAGCRASLIQGFE